MAHKLESTHLCLIKNKVELRIVTNITQAVTFTDSIELLDWMPTWFSTKYDYIPVIHGKCHATAINTILGAA